ncbi:MAG: hypothetical protein ACI9UR_001176 [Bacteroidia bacterium]|jgi:hypothetical protein
MDTGKSNQKNNVKSEHSTKEKAVQTNCLTWFRVSNIPGPKKSKYR